MSSSSSSLQKFSRPKNGYYDVFLSFRGTDTRFVFTNNLYHSLMEKEVHTFMDRDLVGKPIDSLFEIIRRSKMAVVVYSKGFAASDWCLKELDMILQRVKCKDMLIMPIFYKVQVGELKHLNGETAKYLDAHIQEHGKFTVLKWKDAITTLGKVSGSSYKEDSYERDFIADVINIIKRRLEKEWEETCIPKFNPKDVMECPTFEITWKGTEKYMRELKSVDVHPTKPWVLLTVSIGMRIWNYETRAIEKSFEVYKAEFAKFIPEKHWIVTGAEDTSFIRVLDYNTSETLKEFKAHTRYISSVAVHPTLPYMLTASSAYNGDHVIKLWNWEDDWVCQQTFGHFDRVEDVAFNPRDPYSFASVCNSFLKIWRIDSRVPEFTSPKSNGIKHVDYFVGNSDMLYILSSNDVWHHGSMTLVQTPLKHKVGTMTALVHPKLPVILTATWCFPDAGTFRIWNKNTYQLLQERDGSDFGNIESFGFIEASEEVIISCSKGLFLVKFTFAGKQSA